MTGRSAEKSRTLLIFQKEFIVILQHRYYLNFKMTFSINIFEHVNNVKFIKEEIINNFIKKK